MHQRKTTLMLIGLFVFLVTAYTWNRAPLLGHDTTPARLVAINLVKRGEVTLDYYESRIRDGLSYLPYYVLPTANGHIVSRFGIGTPVAAAPFFAVALGSNDGRLSMSAARMVGKIASAVYVALAAVLVAFVCMRLVGNVQLSLILALTYGLGTTAFSLVSQALWQHGPANFFLMGALALVFIPGRMAALLGGICLSAMVSCRPPTMILVICLAVYMILYQRSRLLWWFVGALPITILQCWYNTHFFGAPWIFSQMLHSASPDANIPPSYWQNSMLTGVFGLLFAPSRGLFIFSPIFLLLLWRPWHYLPRLHRLWYFLLAGVVITIVVIGRYWGWHGGWCFGNRMLADLTPILSLALLPIAKDFFQRFSTRWVFGGLLGISIVIHALGAYFYQPFTWDANPDVNHNLHRFWDIRDTQIGYVLQNLKLRH